MNTTTFFIGKLNDKSFVILSTQPTYWMSGYFASYNQRIIAYNETEIHEYAQSSRDGFQKENPDFEYKNLSFEEYDSLKVLLVRLYDLVLGIIELKDYNITKSSKTLYKIEGTSICLLKWLPEDKYEKIEIKKGYESNVKIEIRESYHLTLNNYNPISNELFNLLKSMLENALKDRLSLLNALFKTN